MIPASLRLTMVTTAVRRMMEELDPSIAGNEHMDECRFCGGSWDNEGIFHHNKECHIEVVRVFIKDPFMIVDDYTEAGKHYLGKEQ